MDGSPVSRLKLCGRVLGVCGSQGGCLVCASLVGAHECKAGDVQVEVRSHLLHRALVCGVCGRACHLRQLVAYGNRLNSTIPAAYSDLTSLQCVHRSRRGLCQGVRTCVCRMWGGIRWYQVVCACAGVRCGCQVSAHRWQSAVWVPTGRSLPCNGADVSPTAGLAVCSSAGHHMQQQHGDRARVVTHDS